MKEKIKTLSAGLIIIALTAMLMFYSPQAKAGAVKGGELCSGIIIPSLLPMLILTSTLCKSKISDMINSFFAPVTQKALHLPAPSASAIIFGLVGGYPTGAVLTRELYQSGEISKAQARRIMHFNICPGLAFSVNAVGSLYNDRSKTGFVIYLICLFSSLLTAFVEGLWHKNEQITAKTERQSMKYSDAFCYSVGLTANSLLIMCCYIIFFSSVNEIVNIPRILTPIMEITNGIFSSQKPIPLPYLCFFMELSGLCIQMQIAGIANDFDMYPYELTVSRCIASLIAYFPGKIYVTLYPEQAEVFSNIAYATPKISSVSYGFASVLLLGCVVIVADIKNRKSKLI